ncbi:uncharacterized protein BKA55DRAFT_599159 [Fusarium redolens]|uniref:Uncharacterized protein n=1 Tax=Fusarium redolens TaxID=48865 RepID=A0A9P9FZU6_FUSRE|nr:uncharacterized protein BKA55DRAFT_599159 [Fusarium redolens]KAH7227133.1 hypothetical protein BKA55DRAFT_599159 [Fusarium redolens]
MAIHKVTPILVTGSLFLGLLLAITQSQQEWFLRVGTGIAFLARALLSGAVGFAYTQILWRILRSKSVTIEGVNSLFAAPAPATVTIIACWVNDSIPTVPAPFPKSSYSVDCYGPSISCNTPSNASFAKPLAEAVNNETCCGDFAGYVGFVPSGQTMNNTDEGYALAAKLYVAVPGKPMSSSYIMANKSIKCQIYNSSYAVNLTFDNCQQNITYKSKRLNGVTSIDAALTKANTGSSQFNATVAYISLMGSLGKLLLGSLGISHYGVMCPTQTQIMSSVLMDAKEMQVLGDVNTETDRSETPESVIGNISMSDTLEQLFTNSTISLFSNSKLLQNDTVASRGPITYLSTQIAFSSESRNLFIAYGLGILASAIVIIIGLLCIKSASASYATSFSTILRTTRNPDLDTMIPTAKTTGAEPLSRHVGDMRLVLRRQRRRLEGMDEDMVTLFAVDYMPDKKGTQRESPYDSSRQGDREHQSSDASIELLSDDEHSTVKVSNGNGNSRILPRGT